MIVGEDTNAYETPAGIPNATCQLLDPICMVNIVGFLLTDITNRRDCVDVTIILDKGIHRTVIVARTSWRTGFGCKAFI